MICADRWLRGVEEIPIQEGAQVSFELSCNFASEWVAPFGWYAYVPRALRNNVWVVFANTGNRASGMPDDPAAPRELRHGHSAIIAPDGRIAAAARDDVETMVTRPVEVYSPFSADLVVRATTTSPLITATRRIGPRNLYHPRRTSNFNPQMDAWYRLGAAVIGPGQPKVP
jgi:predicted amidohydrolase